MNPSHTHTTLRSRQRGAAAVFAAVGMIGMLIAAAFAIDLAQLYVAKRQLQNMANLAALDVARAAGGCLAPDQDRQAMANGTALATVSRLGGEASWLQGGGVVLGEVVVDGANVRHFQPTLVEQVGQAYAFDVTLQRSLPPLLMPLPNSSNDGAVMQAKASSTMAPAAVFDVGSALVSLDTSDVPALNALFSSLLGSPLSLDLVHYQGLLGSSVPLLDVADQLAGPTVRQLISEPINAPGLLSAIANALFDTGENIAASAVDAIAAIAPDQDIVLGDVMGSPSDAVTGAGGLVLGTLDLVRALAFQLGEPVLSVTPEITLPGIVETEIQLTVGESPQLGAGPAFRDELQNYMTTAETAQGRVDSTIKIGGILGNVASLNLNLELARARADLEAIRCAGRDRLQHEVDLGVSTSVARLEINNPQSDPLLNVLGLVQVCWVGSVEVGTGQSQLLEFVGPFDPDNPQPQEVSTSLGGGLSNALSDLIIRNPPELCGPLGSLNVVLLLLGLGNENSLLSLVLSGILAPLTSVLDGVLDPLLGAIGLDVAAGEVVVRGVYMPPPALIAAH